VKFTESNIEQQAEAVIRARLEGIPFLKSIDVEREAPVESVSVDILVTVELPNTSQTLLVETKNSGQPRIARDAVNQLRVYLERFPGAYGILLAPYVSPTTASICKEAGIGYIDLAGNCRLSFDAVYIDVRGNPNPFSEKRELKSLFAAKAERVLRALLSMPSRAWKTEEIARAANVSIGQVSNVRKLLIDREWAEERQPGFALTRPSALLESWAFNYRFQRNKLLNLYSMDSVGEIEALVVDVCSQLGIAYALTGFSGAARYASFTTYRGVAAYVSGQLDAITEALNVKPVPSGANLQLITPYDEGVFYAAQTFDGQRVASAIQCYLDLQGQATRGQEAAEALLETGIKPQWQ
jgi:hypothetical protein